MRFREACPAFLSNVSALAHTVGAFQSVLALIRFAGHADHAKRQGFVQSYNAQAVVDQYPIDLGQARPATKSSSAHSGGHRTAVRITARELLADNGCCSETNLEYLDAPVEPGKQIEAYHAAPRRPRPPEDEFGPLFWQHWRQAM